MTQAEIERTLAQFEGLVFETARQVVAGGVELELDDVRQLLRVKVWQAIQAYDAAHTKRMPLRRFVFMCVANLRKDLEKRPRRRNSSIDAIRERTIATGDPGTGSLADWFDSRYLSVGAEQVFARVEDEELRLPSTLTCIERRVVALRLDGLLLLEIDRTLGLSRAQRERVMRSLRAKLADWNPAPGPRAPTPPLPAAEPRLAALAA